MQQVLQSIRKLAERRQEVMMVLSQLEFRKYLDNQVDPITAAATRLLQQPATLGNPDGDFDVLIISRQYGLIVGEVKSVGDNPQHTTDQAIVKRVKKAVKQLKKAGDTVKGLVSDLAPVSVTRILMLPNITSQQLMTALSTDPQTEQDLCLCVGATDTAAAVARCLCADSSEWWERSVTDHGRDTNMTNDIYERLVARFCGPATSIEVPTVALVNRPEPQPPQQDLVLLWGPPGHDLQYRDTIILCNVPRDDLPVVSRLRARGLPVQVVTSRDDEAAIRDLAVTRKDTIMVTDRGIGTTGALGAQAPV
nr:hypothetical protein BaRGS_001805 [Batillaria attramentaria]